MTVAQLIELLQTMPQDATVTVLRHTQGYGYYDQGGWCNRTDFDDSYELNNGKLFIGEEK